METLRKSEKKKLKNLVIDVDRAIEKYNKKHPELRQLDRKRLAEICECNKQVFTDWKGGKTPSLVYRLFAIMEATETELEDFIVPENEV